MSNYIKRFVPVLLVLVVCISCLVSPVSAASSGDGEFYSYDLLDYTSVNTEGNQFRITDETVIVLDLPDIRAFSGFDIIASISSVSGLTVSVSPNGTNYYPLTVKQIDNTFYRFFGDVYFRTYEQLYIKFTSSTNATKRCTLLSVKCASTSSPIYDLGGKIRISSGVGEAEYVWSSGETVSLDFPVKSDMTVWSSFDAYLYPYKWELYDSVYLRFMYYGSLPFTISASCNGTVVPFTSSYFSTEIDDLNYHLFNVKLDVSDLDRSLGVDNNPICLRIQADHYPTAPTKFYIYDCYGVVDVPAPSKFALLTTKLESWFATLFDKFDEAFGLNDDSASDALQTQEEINVSINTQLVGAVEDWNTNIEVVQTGYDTALYKATPALGWLATLADRVFTNMGWFGNIYFLIGLISVLMLVLSKSGLARSVGRIRRGG